MVVVVVVAAAAGLLCSSPRMVDDMLCISLVLCVFEFSRSCLGVFSLIDFVWLRMSQLGVGMREQEVTTERAQW